MPWGQGQRLTKCQQANRPALPSRNPSVDSAPTELAEGHRHGPCRSDHPSPLVLTEAPVAEAGLTPCPACCLAHPASCRAPAVTRDWDREAEGHTTILGQPHLVPAGPPVRETERPGAASL